MRLFRRAAREDDRTRLLRLLPHNAVCAEIGVLEGDFSERIIALTRPRRLHLIDPWKFEPGATYERAVYGRAHAHDQAHMDEMCERVRERFEQEIRTGAVVMHRASSLEAAGHFENEYFDFIYIDANHQYEFVRQDLETYCPKVKTGGFITGDDYGVSGWWGDGVTRAVDEFVTRGGCVRRRTRDSQFVLRRR
ncbi:MAG: class I SAM-dependent methyltransferase [Candidatus Binataceae bacterium]